MCLERELVLILIHIDAMAVSINQSLAPSYAFKVSVLLPVGLNHHGMVQLVLFAVILRIVVVGVELVDGLAVKFFVVLVGVKIAPFGAAATHLGVVHFSLALLLVVEHEHALLQEEAFLFASVFKELWL